MYVWKIQSLSGKTLTKNKGRKNIMKRFILMVLMLVLVYISNVFSYSLGTNTPICDDNSTQYSVQEYQEVKLNKFKWWLEDIYLDDSTTPFIEKDNNDNNIPIFPKLTTILFLSCGLVFFADMSRRKIFRS